MAFDPTKFGAKKIGTVQPGQQSTQQFGQTGSVAPTTQKQDQPGIFSQLINDPFKTLVAKPAIRFGQALGAPIAFGASAITGNPQYKKNYLSAIGKDVQIPGVIPGTSVNIEATKPGLSGAKQIVGEGLKTASYLTPSVGIAGRPLVNAALTGASQAGLYGTGDALAEDKSIGTALKTGLESAVAGAALGGVLHGATKIPKVASAVAKWGTGQITGFSPETVKTLVTAPEKLTPEIMQSFDRASVANKVETAIRDGVSGVRNLGSEYNDIRAINRPIQVPGDLFPAVMAKYGIQMEPVTNKAGKLVDVNFNLTADSVPVSDADLKEFKDFYLRYGKENVLSPNGLLNSRQFIDSRLANYNKLLGQTDVSNKIGTDLRNAYDQIAANQLPELKAQDAAYAPQRKQFERLQKDYLNPDLSLKDGALNKIANLTGKGKDLVLARLEEVVPGISADINTVKAIEDIASSNGIKVGTYLKSGIIGLASSGGNPVVALLSALMATPEVSVPVLRTFGKLNNRFIQPTEQIIKKLAGGKTLTSMEKKILWAAIGHFANLANREGDPVKKKNNSEATDDYLKSLGL